LCSQARKAFGDEAKFEVGSWSDSGAWGKFDFLISTTPIPETELPVVVVSLLLADVDKQRIAVEIQKAATRKNDVDRPGQHPGITRRFETLENLAAAARVMVANFRAVPVDGDVTFPELARILGETYGTTPEQATAITAGITEREAATTQVLKELDLVFLYCPTDGVTRPVFGLVVPDGDAFTDPYFQDVMGGIIILIPRDSSPEQFAMIGSISTALVDNKIFLSDILAGNVERVSLHTEAILERFLQRYVAEGFDST
ncbi:MAG: hypothetical protein LIQ31_13280, partial [Planctomycetes bacterium]|nr:hypothetical protein [Planctomycetota bacterium]